MIIRHLDYSLTEYNSLLEIFLLVNNIDKNGRCENNRNTNSI